MNLTKVKKLQKQFGFDGIQELINNGSAWTMEGAIGREATHTLQIGATLLPDKSFTGPYGNFVPSRKMVKDGTTGSRMNCIRYWTDRELVGGIEDEW